MSYSEIVVIILSFLSVLICLFTIWLAILFYRLYTQFSLMVTEMSKGLDISTIRLGRLPKILYNKELVLPKSFSPDNQIIEEKTKQKNIEMPDQLSKTPKQEREISNNKKQDKNLSKQIVQESEEI